MLPLKRRAEKKENKIRSSVVVIPAVTSNLPWSIVAHPQLVVTPLGEIVRESTADQIRLSPDELRVVAVLGGVRSAERVQADLLEPAVDASLEISRLLVQWRRAPHESQVLAHNESVQVAIVVVLKDALIRPLLRLNGQLFVPFDLHHVLCAGLAVHLTHCY